MERREVEEGEQATPPRASSSKASAVARSTSPRMMMMNSHHAKPHHPLDVNKSGGRSPRIPQNKEGGGGSSPNYRSISPAAAYQTTPSSSTATFCANPGATIGIPPGLSNSSGGVGSSSSSSSSNYEGSAGSRLTRSNSYNFKNSSSSSSGNSSNSGYNNSADIRVSNNGKLNSKILNHLDNKCLKISERSLKRIILNDLNSASFIGFCEHETFNECSVKFQVDFLLKKEIDYISITSTLISDFSKLFNYTNRMNLFSQVKSLNLSDNNLTDVPGEIASLPLLELLDLSSNSISSLPPAFFELQNLRKCKLDNNNISTLPFKITEMKTLVEFSIVSNPLKSPPLSIFTKKSKNNHQISREDNGLSQLEDIKAFFEERSNTLLSVGIKVCTFHQLPKQQQQQKQQQPDLNKAPSKSQDSSTGFGYIEPNKRTKIQTMSGRSIEPFYNNQDCTTFTSFKQLFPKQAVYVVYPGPSQNPIPTISRTNSIDRGYLLHSDAMSTSISDAPLNTAPSSSAPSLYQDVDFRYVTDTINTILNHQPCAFIVVVISDQSSAFQNNIAMLRKLESLYRGYRGESSCVHLINNLDTIKSITLSENSPTILVLDDKDSSLEDDKVNEGNNIIDFLNSLSLTFSSSNAEFYNQQVSEKVGVVQSSRIDELHSVIKEGKAVADVNYIRAKFEERMRRGSSCSSQTSSFNSVDSEENDRRQRADSYSPQEETVGGFEKLLQCLHNSGRIIWLGAPYDYIFKDISFPIKIIEQFRSDLGSEKIESSYFLYLWTLHFINGQGALISSELDYKEMIVEAITSSGISYITPSSLRGVQGGDEGGKNEVANEKELNFGKKKGYGAGRGVDIGDCGKNEGRVLDSERKDYFEDNSNNNDNNATTSTSDVSEGIWSRFLKSASKLIDVFTGCEGKETSSQKNDYMRLHKLVGVVRDVLIESKEILLLRMPDLLEEQRYSIYFFAQTKSQDVIPCITRIDNVLVGQRATVIETMEDKQVYYNRFLQDGKAHFRASIFGGNSDRSAASLPSASSKSLFDTALDSDISSVYTSISDFYYMFLFRHPKSDTKSSLQFAPQSPELAAVHTQLTHNFDWKRLSPPARRYLHKYEFQYFIPPNAVMTIFDHFYNRVLRRVHSDVTEKSAKWESWFIKAPDLANFRVVIISDNRFELRCRVTARKYEMVNWYIAVYYNSYDSDRGDNDYDYHDEGDSKSIAVEACICDSNYPRVLGHMKMMGAMIRDIFGCSSSGGGSSGNSSLGVSAGRNALSPRSPPRHILTCSSSSSGGGSSSTSSGGGIGGGFKSNLIVSRKYMCPNCMIEKIEKEERDELWNRDPVGGGARKIGELNANSIDREEESLVNTIKVIRRNNSRLDQQQQMQQQMQQHMRSWLSKPFTCSLTCDVDKRELIVYSDDLLELIRKVEEAEKAIPFLLSAVISSEGAEFDNLKKSVVKLIFSVDVGGGQLIHLFGSGVVIQAKSSVNKGKIEKEDRSGKMNMYILSAAHVLIFSDSCITGLKDIERCLRSSKIFIIGDEGHLFYSGAFDILLFSRTPDMMLLQVDLSSSSNTSSPTATFSSTSSSTFSSTTSPLSLNRGSYSCSSAPIIPNTPITPPLSIMLPGLEVLDNTSPFVGQIVRSMGYQDSDSLCSDFGYIEKVSSSEVVVGMYCCPGASGGPLMDTKGRVLGILSTGLLMKSTFGLTSGLWDKVSSYNHAIDSDHFVIELGKFYSIVKKK